MGDNKEKDVKNFVVNYEDGSQKTIEKGFFCEMKELPDGACDMSFSMTGVSGRDLEHIVFGCIELGDRLGMFRKNDCGEENKENE